MQDFGELPNLSMLALSNNKLTGAIPDLSSLTNLTRIALHDNQLCKKNHINYATWPIEYAYLIGNSWSPSPTWQEVLNGFPHCVVNHHVPTTTIQMDLNSFRYTAADTFRLDMTVASEGLADTYVAIVFPDDNFVTLSYPDKFSFLNTAQPYRQGMTISGQRVYSSVLELVLPSGLPVGGYSACGVLVQPNAADVLDSRNWIHLDCAAFEVY